jgi:hypothetical protein
VVIEPDERIAEIYTHDEQLIQSWSLSEGRQRKNSHKFFEFNASLSDADSAGMLTQDEQSEGERAMMKKIEDMKERESEREKRVDALKLQMEQMREELRLRTVGDEDQGEMAQDQEKPEEGIGKKRNR